MTERRLFSKLIEGFDHLDKQGKMLVTNEVERKSAEEASANQAEEMQNKSASINKTVRRSSLGRLHELWLESDDGGKRADLLRELCKNPQVPVGREGCFRPFY